MNEFLFYSEINKQSAADFIQRLGWIEDGTTYVSRIFTPGGDVEAGWGMIAKMNELRDTKKCRSIAKVDGMAASMGGVLLAFFDERECLDVSSIMIHRGQYSEQDENGNKIKLTPEEKANLAIINKNLKLKLAQVINNDQLKKLKGYTLDDLFDESKDRINCWLTPQEAQEIGLITKIVKVDAKNGQNIAQAAQACYKTTAVTAGTSNKQTMTAEELKKENPEAAAELEKEAVKAYKAKMKAKAKEEEEDPDDPEDEDEDCEPKDKKAKKAAAEQRRIDAAVESRLKELGIAAVTGSDIKASAIAFAKAQEKEKEVKAEQEKTLDDLKKEVNAIITGKKVE